MTFMVLQFMLELSIIIWSWCSYCQSCWFWTSIYGWACFIAFCEMYDCHITPSLETLARPRAWLTQHKITTNHDSCLTKGQSPQRVDTKQCIQHNSQHIKLQNNMRLQEIAGGRTAMEGQTRYEHHYWRGDVWSRCYSLDWKSYIMSLCLHGMKLAEPVSLSHG